MVKKNAQVALSQSKAFETNVNNHSHYPNSHHPFPPPKKNNAEL